jgi:hypothetical protein
VSAGDLLLEGAGTNLLLKSEEFETTWVLTRATVSANSATTPSGSATADTLIANTDTNTHQILQNYTYTAGIHTFSVFCKPAGYPGIRLLMFDGTGTSGVIYNVNTGDFVSSSGSVTSHSSTALANGWYRIAMSITAAAGAGNVSIRPVNDINSDNFAGDGTSGIYVWGAQLEANSYPTSYIPTSGSTATRAADVSTSAATFGNSWYEQDEGTVFANQTSLSTVPQDFATVFQFNDATATNVLFIRKRPGFSQWVTSGENSLFMIRTINQPSVLSVAYKTDDAVFAAEGTLTDDNSCTIDPNKVELLIGNNTTNYLNGTISRLTYWPTRLSNDTLQTITT